MQQAMLELKNVGKTFRMGSMLFGSKIRAVEGVSLSLPASEPWIMSIVGESGSGKTTLARMILRLLQPTEGEILLAGEPVGAYRSGRRRKEFYHKVQTISQNPFSAFSSLKTVDSYLYETALNLKICSTREEATGLITRTLRDVGLEFSQVAGKYPNQFSGGELQRISIARALLPHPLLIVADEPVAMIDASLRMNVVNLFKRLKTDYRTNFVYITHDLSTAYYVSDYIAIMYRGQIVEFGPAREILAQPAHPYTGLLLDSIPKVGQKWETDVALPDLESVEYGLEGCKLIARCPNASPECGKGLPPRCDLGNGHTVLCHQYKGERVSQAEA